MVSAQTQIKRLLVLAFAGLVACTQPPPAPSFPPPEGSLSVHGGWSSRVHVLGINSDGMPVVAWSEGWSICRVLNRTYSCYGGGEQNTKTWNGQTWSLKQIESGGGFPFSFNNDKLYGFSLDGGGYPWNVRYDLVVWRWGGSSWAKMTEKLSVDLAQNILSITVALDSKEYPVVGWVRVKGYPVKPTALEELTTELPMHRWDGGKWVQIGDVVERLQGDFDRIRELAIALDSADSPILAYSVAPATGSYNLTNIQVKRWTGAQWVALGNRLNATDFAIGPKIQVSTQEEPVVAFIDNNLLKVKRWNGESWVELGNGVQVNQPRSFSMDLDSKNNPVVAFKSDAEGASPDKTTIQVNRWDGTAWNTVGTIHKLSEAESIGEPQLVMTPNDMVVVVYLQSYPRLVYPSPYYTDSSPTYLFAEMWNQ